MTAVERASQLMGHLRTIKGQCPSDAALAAEIGCREDQAAEALAFLEANGLIQVERAITILVERKAT